MILQGLSIELLIRLMSFDRPGDSDSWLLFGPEPPAEQDDEQDFRWAAE